MGRPWVKAAGITAGTLFIAIGLSAQFGGADLFGAAANRGPVSQAHAPQASPPPSPSPKASPQTVAPVAQAVSAQGTIYPPGYGGGGHKKHK
jgi:hypothetical protein